MSRHIADFHVHSSSSRDGNIDPARLVETAVARGLSAIAICDHGEIAGALEARRHAEKIAAPLLVIVGEEMRTTEGEIIGLFLSERIEQKLTPEETVSAIQAQGGLVYVPHPFDRMRTSPIQPGALERISADVDLVEIFNARNLMHADNEEAATWALERGVPALAGSDAHTLGEIGNVRVELPYFEDAEGLLGVAREAELHVQAAGLLPHLMTAWVKRTKRSQ
jgi:predicted metal-dependent phosphoesterase TrpH